MALRRGRAAGNIRKFKLIFFIPNSRYHYQQDVKMNSGAPIERVNYFHGQILSSADFQAEQEYCLAKFRRHNRYLHGWGVVCGLKVSNVSPFEIMVEPGVAIDCAGNEIHVGAPVKMAIPQAARVQFVVLQYEETKTSPVPVVSAEAGTPEEEMAFSRIVEGYHLEILDHDPTARHGGKGPGTPGCGRLHPVCIARLRKGPRRWRVERRRRRRGWLR
jgi:hypothetical protein